MRMIVAVPQPDVTEIQSFDSKKAWAKWLKRNHAKSAGVWLRLAKKGAESPSISHGDALEVALCYGWIDGQKRPESAVAWLERFLPRSTKSLWSKMNREKALALIASGEMKPAGLRAIEEAKQSGRWDAAYDPPSRATVPQDLQAALEANPRAKRFFETLDRTNRYAILWRVQTAKKAETRARKITEFVGMLEKNQKIHG